MVVISCAKSIEKEVRKSIKHAKYFNSWTHSNCTALPRVGFLSNPRRTHSKREDEEKGEQGLPRAPICCSTTFPSPSPSPYTRTARLLDCLGLRYQDTSPPLPSTYTQAKISDF